MLRPNPQQVQPNEEGRNQNQNGNAPLGPNNINNNQVADVIDVPQPLKMLEDIQAEFNEYHAMGLITSEIRNNILTRRAAAIDRIPNFWMYALVGLRDPNMEIPASDREVLRFLRSIEMESVWEEMESERDVKREAGFKLKFIFQELTPYFPNRELVREYMIPVGRPLKRKSTTSIDWIDWRFGFANATFPRRRDGPQATFFSWYSNIMPLYSHIDNAIANRMRDQLWADPLKFYRIGIA